ncbi:amino acid adenylation domain-containing protein [Chitinophaga ginsengisegetis]
MSENSMLNIKALESNKNISARNYWKQRLKNFRAENCFDGATDDQQLPSGNTYGVYTVEIPRHVSGNLNGIASSDKAKHIVLLSALSVLIQKYSSTGKVLLFTHTYSEEEKQDAGKGIIPVGIDIAPDTDFSTLVNTVKENLFSDFRHARYPLERILAGSPAIKRISGVGLGMKGIALPIDVNGCSLDLYFSFHAEDQKLDVWYHHSRFTYNFVQNITAVFLSLLSRITQNSRNSLQNIPLLTEQERLQVFNELTVFGNHASQAESVLVRTSYHQERLWFIDKFEKDYLYNGSPVYHNIPLEIGLKGTLNVEWLEESINSVIRHYSALRTCFVEVKDIIFQQPVNDAGIQLEKRTHRHKGSSLEAEITSERDKPFDPATPPVRAVLFETDTDSYKLLLIFHHLVVDRHATLQVARDILENYRRRSQGELFLEETERLRYAQFSEWQRGPLSKLYFYLFPYWKQRLGTRLKALELPTDRPRSAVHIYKGAAIDVSLSQHISSQVLRYAEQRLISPRLIFMAAFKILLYKYVQHEEIVIGTSTDSRNNGVLKDVVGPLANLLPVRSQIFPSDSFQEYLTRLNNQFNADLSHSDIPFDKLVSYLAPEKDMSRTALFDVLFQYENKSYEIPRIDDLHIDLFENNYGYGKYDLSLLLLQSEDGVEGKMLYNSEYFDQASVELMMQRFSRLLGSLLLQPSRQLWEIDILDDVEKKGLLDSLDYTNSHYPEDKTILDLFDEQVTKWPGNTAVQYEGVAITYAQLDEQAGQVAAQLTARGVKADAVVGLLMDRSIEMVVGMLGILKAGGAYLPVDITYPEERRNYLLDNSQTRLVLTTNEFADLVKPGISVVLIEDREQFNGVLPDKPLPSNLCYVIYTSGTTGNPKGVMVEHRNVVRLFCNDDFQFSFGPADIWTMFHSHCFDFSVWEIFGALLTGGKVIIVPKMTARDTGLYLKLLREEGVTVLNQTPSAFYNLLQLSVTGLSLRYVIFGGEALSPGKLHSWREMYPGVKLINMYGITETTVHVTYKEITEKEIGSNISNIGKPIPTLSVYLLDEHQRLVPAGITGELYVGGSGVSRGYLGNEALTSAKFVQDPYKTGGRLYRTGDLGRLLPGGEIEYLGRKDHQVQLRGFRIELGEIAYALSGNSRIGEVVVEAREKEDDKYLVAYYTADQEIKVSELRTYLLGKIPDYMVPSYFVYLDHFPLTSNGKLDRAALPEPHISATDEYIPPSGIVETKLVEIWADILKLDKDSISVNSSFFDLGGHSLRATVLVNKILSELGTEVPLKEIFERRVVSSLAEYIRQVGAMQVSRVPKATPKPYYSLSPAQKAIYYFSEYDKQTLAYNMPRVVVMEGSLDKDKLKQVMEQLVARHEAFRTSFQVIGEEVVQQIADSAVLTITHHVAAEEDVKQLVQQIIARFDLSSAPLLRVALIEVQPEKHVLVVDTHHLVMDGTSWGIFIREFKTLFNNGTLAPLTLQYKDYVEWLDTEERRAEMDKQNDFWYGELSRNMPQLDLPVDFERPEQKNNHAGNVNFRIEEEQTGHLKAIADKEGATLFIVLLSVYNILLEKITNQEDIMIGIPASGRDHSDLQHMLGMFVKILPFRNFPAEQLSFRQFMNEVKERTFAFLENQSYEYHRLLDRLKIRRARAHSALYDVMFVFQNFEETRFVIPDLKISSYKASHLVAEFDMSLTAFENNGEIRLAIGYQDSLFKPETILKFAAYFRKIVAAVVADPDIKISDIYVVSEDERKALLDRFRGNGNNIQTETILSRFEKSVSRFQGKTAIRYKDISWSYTDVDRISNQIAYHLKENAGVGKSMLVGVMMERDEYLVPTILGILKTGAAFVPLDPAYPPGISDTLISKAGVGVLITGNITFDVSAINVKVLNIQQEWNPILESRELPLASGVTADDLAYVMYSLESLSNPTGFMFSHQALFSALAGMQDTYPVQETGGYLLRTNTSVQSALQEIFNWCLSGGCLSILPPENESEIDKIISWIEAYGITHVHFEAPVFSAFTDVLTRRGREKIKSLQHIFLTGMGTWADPVRKFSQLNTGILLEDMFGVPEYAIFACGRTLPAPGATNARILYQALPGAALYTVDRNNKLQADGLYGSLCIGGTGLASDYLTEEELCHQLYFPLPELEVNVIKTPWQARYLAENGIEFSAREAGPLMLNGHRAVLSEIEAVIMRHGEVTNTVVIIPGNQPPGKRLLALVELPDKSATVGKIKKYLRSQLPRHMMPTDVIKFGHLPLTAAGTVDRDAIPALLERSAIVIDEAAQPQTAVEKQIALIWKELMGLEQVTLNDTFFGLGGHSLLLVTNNERMKKQFNVDLPFSIYFNCTLKQIAEKVSQTSPHKVAE